MTSKRSNPTAKKSDKGGLTRRRGKRDTKASQPTLEDVARVSGCSVITVMRALNQPDMVRAKTRADIQKAIERTGYVPNLAARGLTRHKTELVGMTIPSLNNSFWASIAQGVSDGLISTPYQLIVGSLQDVPDMSREQETTIRAFLGRRPDGLVLCPFDLTDNARKLIKNSAVPVVEIASIPPDPIDMVVGFNNRAAMNAITNLLIHRGHRNIGYLGGDYVNNKMTDDRLYGFRDAMAEARLKIDDGWITLANVPTTIMSSEHAFGALLQRAPELTAVVCGGDYFAHGAIFWCNENEIAIPDRMAIVGIGDMEISAHINPSLTTVRTGGHRIGLQAARMLLCRFRGERLSHTIDDVGFEIVERDSC